MQLINITFDWLFNGQRNSMRKTYEHTATFETKKKKKKNWFIESNDLIHAQSQFMENVIQKNAANNYY